MNGLARLAALCALGTLLGIGLLACGGGGSSTSASTQASRGSSQGKAEASQSVGTHGANNSESGGRSKPSGGPTGVRKFGEEGSSAEREAAAQVLEGFLKARAAGKWAAECNYAGKPAISTLESLASSNPQYKSAGCPVLLAALAELQPRKALVDNLEAPIISLRVKGIRGVVVYRGTGGGEYAMPMVREGGDWKVASLVSNQLSS